MRTTKAQLAEQVEALNARVGELEAELSKRAPHEPSGGDVAIERVFAAISDAVIVTDRKRRIVKVNSAFTRIFGYEPDEVLGESAQALYAEQDEFRKQGRRRFNTDAPDMHDIYETHYRRKTGEVFPSETVGTPVRDSQGVLLGFLGIVRDITERKRAEAALQKSEAILNETGSIARVGGWEHDLVTGEATWTRALYEIIEVDSGPPPGVNEHLSYYPEKDRRILEEAYTKAVEEGIPFALELQGHTAKGRLIWCRAIGHPVYRDGKCVKMRGTFQDITERKNAEAGRLAHVRFLEALERVDAAMRGNADVENVLDAVVAAVLSIFDCDRAWLVHPCDPAAPSFRVPFERTNPGYPGARAQNLEVSMEDDVAEYCRSALMSNGPVVFRECPERPVLGRTSQRFAVRSWMFMRVRPTTGAPWLIGVHQCTHARDWTLEEQRLFREIGRRVGDVLSVLLMVRELKTSEERLHLALWGAGLGTWDWNVPSGAMTFDKRWVEMLGYTLDEVEPHVRSWERLVHSDDMPRVQSALTEHLAGRTPFYETEHRLRHKSGAWIWVLDRGRVIDRDAAGKPVRACGTHLDITERKRAEEALRVSEGKLSAMLASLTDHMSMMDGDLNILWANAAAKGLFGEDLVGKKCYQVYHGREAPCEPYPCLALKAFENGGAHVHETQVIDKDGQTRCFHSTANVALRDENGNPTAVVEISRDITENRRVEGALTLGNERLGLIARVTSAVVGARALAELGPNLAQQVRSAFGVDGCVIRVVEGEKLVLLGSDGIPVEKLRSRIDVGWGLSKEIISSRRPIGIIDVRSHPATASVANRHDNAYRFISYAGAPLLVKDEVIGILAIYTVTEQRDFTDSDLEHLQIVAANIGIAISNARLYEEVQRRAGELEERVQARTAELKAVHRELLQHERLATLGQLTATVSHELRNPLGTVRSSVFTIGAAIRKLDLGLDDILNRAERNIVRCDDIIEELLDYTRTREITPVRTAVDEWLGRVVADQTIPEGVSVSLRLAAGIELAIDREKLRRCLINLISNAHQAMTEAEAGGGQLTIASRVAGERLEISVSDTGPGIPIHQLDKVFEPLFSTKGFGIGLGLPVVRQIAESHGGGVELTNGPGTGAIATLWLPLQTCAEPGSVPKI